MWKTNTKKNKRKKGKRFAFFGLGSFQQGSRILLCAYGCVGFRSSEPAHNSPHCFDGMRNRWYRGDG